MTRVRTTGLGLMASAAVVLALVTGLMATQVSAVSHTISIGSATMVSGGQASVDLQALNITAPGLGAWTIDITYDPAVVTAVACSAEQGGVCNPTFAADTVRVTGASGTGLQGDITLGTITFRCAVEASSALALILRTLADATPGDPQPMDTARQNGRVTCVEAPTPSPPPSTSTPVPPPAPTSTPPRFEQSSCEPSYPDVCIPLGSADYDCEGGSDDGPNYVRGPILVLPPDPHALDDDGDGIGCESGISQVAGVSAGPSVPDTGFGPYGSDAGGALNLLSAGLTGAGLAWLIVVLTGAGLATVGGSGAPPRAGMEPPDVAVSGRSGGGSGMSWLVAARNRLVGADLRGIPEFRARRRARGR